MPLDLNSVLSRLIAIECCDLNNSITENGTAFWGSVNGSIKLITARHIPWNFMGNPPVSTPASKSGIFNVKWHMENGSTGGGTAKIHAHPLSTFSNQDFDYSWIDFCDPDNEPVGRNNPFSISAVPANTMASVVAAGFKGCFNSATHPSHAVGLIEGISPRGKITVCGSAFPGFSGGPAFEYQSEAEVKDLVIGLVSGQPHLNAILNQSCTDLFILESSTNFC